MAERKLGIWKLKGCAEQAKSSVSTCEETEDVEHKTSGGSLGVPNNGVTQYIGQISF